LAHIKTVFCKRCGEGKKIISLYVCKECMDYYCGDHIYDHKECSAGKWYGMQTYHKQWWS
jgi:hypothetical protein